MRIRHSRPRRTFISILVLFALLSAAIGAQENETALAPDETLPPPLSIEATLAQTFRMSYPVAGGEDGLDSFAKVPRMGTEFKAEAEKGDVKVISQWSLLTAATRIDDASGIGDGSSYFSIEPMENAVYLSTASAKIGLGWQYFSWGVADKINPTDALNARDYRYGLEEQKLPVFAGALAWYPRDELGLDIVYVPLFRSSIYGMNASEVIPSALFNGLDLTTGSPQLAPHSPSISETRPKAEAGSFTLGIRGRYHGSLFDSAVSYVYGWDEYPSPDIALVAEATGGGELGLPDAYYRVGHIDLEYRRMHRFGADVKFVVGRFGVWAEGAVGVGETVGQSYENRKPKLSWVAGFDFNFGSQEEHYLNLQYTGTYIPGYDDSFSGDYPNGEPEPSLVGDADYMREFYYRSLVQTLGLQREGLSHGLAGTVEFSFLTGKVKPTLEFLGSIPLLYDDSDITRYLSVALMPKLKLLPVDGLTVTLGAETAWSFVVEDGGSVELDKTDAIGSFTDDNRVYVEVRYVLSLD